MSGTKRLASITRPAVSDSHTVSNTGAVERYFKKLLSILCYLLVIYYLGETVISSAGAISLPLVNSLNAANGQTNPVATKLSATGTFIIISLSVGLSVPLANCT